MSDEHFENYDLLISMSMLANVTVGMRVQHIRSQKNATAARTGYNTSEDTDS